MGDNVKQVRAETLVREIAGQLGYPEEEILSLFNGAPLDFPIFFTRRLPFLVHRFGMVGITLTARVWLLEHVIERDPVLLLALIRHEGEHVVQQRKSPLFFYPGYLFSWFKHLFSLSPSEELQSFRKRFGRSYAAYRAIPYEVEAYAAGDSLAERVRERVNSTFKRQN